MQQSAGQYHIGPLEEGGEVADQWLGFAVREFSALEQRPILVVAAAENR